MQFEDSFLFKQLNRTGDFSELKPVEVLHTASGAQFCRGTLASDGTDCFLKHYAAGFAASVEREIQYVQAFAQLVREKGFKYIDTIIPIKRYVLDDGSIVVASKFYEGTLLADIALRKKPLSPTTSQCIRAGLFECAQALQISDFAHRDVCPKNIMLVGQKLFLFDFLTVIKKQNPIVVNPSVRELRNLGGLGHGFSPKRGEWNDVFSLARVYEKLANVLVLDTKSEDIAKLYEMSKDCITLRHDFVVDHEWKRAIMRDYLKVLFRPSWTCKPSSKSKRRFVLDTVRMLLKSLE